MVLVLTPKDIKGLITMKEAVDAMEQGFLDWSKNEWLAELRQRVHSEAGVRLTVHIGAPNTPNTIGTLIPPKNPLSVKTIVRHILIVAPEFALSTKAILVAYCLYRSVSSRLRNCPA